MWCLKQRRKGKDLVLLDWDQVDSFNSSKGMFIVLTGCLGYDRYVDGWMLKLVLPDWSSKCWQTDPRKPAKSVGFQEKLHAQGRVLFRLGFWEAELVCFLKQRDFDDPEIDDFDQRIRRKITNFGDPSGQKHVGGRRRDTHTADKVLTHGQTLLFYRYRSTVSLLLFACFSTIPCGNCKKTRRTVQKTTFCFYDWKPSWPELFSFSVPFSIITHEHSKKIRFSTSQHKKVGSQGKKLAKCGIETTAVTQKKYNKNIKTLLAKQNFPSLFETSS